MITSEEIKRTLWAAANQLRGSMDASRYKDYMLGLMFYKFLSDKTLDTYRKLGKYFDLTEQELIDQYKEQTDQQGLRLYGLIEKTQGYYVEAKYLYQMWLRDIDAGEFELEKVIESLNNFERTISKDSDDFKGLFSSSTMDLSNTALGSSLKDRSNSIKSLIELFADKNMVELQEGDVLGDAYEYLIGMFAMESGKKAGEFYTPRQVSEVMAQIVAESGKIRDIYDPTVGSGSLLLTVRKHLNPDEQKLLSYYGQEKNTATFNLTRMNLLLHGVRPESMTIKNGDSLDEDWPEDPKRPGEGIQFDAVVMNPPYSLSNWNKGELKITDPRFESVGALPPDSKGDYAFLLHGLYHLAPQGTMAIVLPHGVLFRGASEGQIRQKLLQSSKIDTIIGLPANLFTNTGIPVCVMILKKDRNLDDPVLFIDASKSFVKEGKQNALQDKDIAKIVDVYRERKEITGYSKLASTDEIIENEYNLNIPRYVDSIDEEIPHDVDAHLFGGIPKKNITQLNVLNNTVKDTLYSHFDEVRPGYLKLNTSIEELSDSIFKDQYIIEKTEAVKVSVETYIGKYMDEIRKIDNVESISLIKERMLSEIRDIIGESRFINEYDGYQIVSEIWNDFLKKDSEVIAQKGFYDSGKSRVPNMVKKGKSSEEIQEGWNGVIISNELIEKYLYKEEREQIEDIQSSIQEIESELNELVELAKQDDTDENIALYESLKKDKEGEVKDSFDNAAIKRELAKADKESLDYSLFSKVNEFNKDKTALTKTLKDREKELKNKVYERFEKLTEGEIDELLYIKWFKDSKTRLLELVRKPLESELAIIKMLNERYSDTIEDIDAQIAQITKEFEELASQLVVTE